MRKNKKKYVYVKLQFLDGNYVDYMLPNDLQKAIWKHIKNNPNTWRQMLDGALMNAPVRQYDAHGNTVIRVGIVKAQFIRNRSQVLRTRSQFIPKERWCSSIRNLNTRYRFLLHDFPWWNKLIITFDVARLWLREQV
ncbi:hypothetical protein FVI60_09040 [Campylobacter jejuni]|nr:hypothetical protein [Campylobacter jejuni]